MTIVASNFIPPISDADQQLRRAEAAYTNVRSSYLTINDSSSITTDLSKKWRDEIVNDDRFSQIGSRLTGLSGELGSEFFKINTASLQSQVGEFSNELSGYGTAIYDATTNTGRAIVDSASSTAERLFANVGQDASEAFQQVQTVANVIPGLNFANADDTIRSTISNVSRNLTVDNSGVQLPKDFTTIGQGGDQSDQDRQEVQGNKLLTYQSFTYRIVLQILSVQQYNAIITSQAVPSENEIIAATGGSETFKKNFAFSSDFFIDDLEIETIVGMNAQARGSNVTNMSFTIIEPNGVSLIERIILASRAAGITGNFLEQPYLMTIKFYGYDETGQPVEITDVPPKYIPFRMIGIDFDINTSGSRYHITAMPYHDAAMQHVIGTIPYEMEIESNNVSSIFDKGTRVTILEQTTNREEVEFERAQGNNIRERVFSNRTTKTKGLISILNDNQKTLVSSGKQAFPDIYEIAFDDFFNSQIEILDIELPEKITGNKKPTKLHEPANSQMYDRNRIDIVQNSNSGKGKVDVKIKKERVSIGTQITEVINRLMKQTKYIRSQFNVSGILNEDKKRLKNEPLNWWKIIPEITLLQWDPKRNEYQKKIRYIVKPYKIVGLYNDNVPITQINAIKEYNYIFTGKNEDVFQFDINVNALYYEARTITSTAQDGQKIRESNDDTGGSVTKRNDSTSTPFGQPVKRTINRSPENIQHNADKIAIAINDVATQIYNQAKADFISAELTIVGDPDFIKQEQIFFGASSWSSPRLPKNQGVSFDSQDVYVRFNVVTPSFDGINEEIGELKPAVESNGTPSKSIFSGMYKPLRVMSSFSEGRFMQQLSCVKAIGGQNDAVIPQEKTEPSYPEGIFPQGPF